MSSREKYKIKKPFFEKGEYFFKMIGKVRLVHVFDCTVGQMGEACYTGQLKTLSGVKYRMSSREKYKIMKPFLKKVNIFLRWLGKSG